MAASERKSPLLTLLSRSKLIVQALLAHGADGGGRNCFGEAPLHLAIQYYDNNYHDMFKSLLEHSADVNAADRFGRTPMHYACVNVEHNPDEALTFLLENGADFNASSGS
jgi:ankyrin repeat protein